METKLVFEFGKYTEVTDLALRTNPEYNNANIVRVFICPDVTDFWLVRVLKDMNEEYETENGTFLIERNNIPKNNRNETLSLSRVISILKHDDFSNYDILECHSLEDVIEILDDGFGINNLINLE